MSTTPRTDAALLSSDCAWNCGHTFKLLIEEKYDQGKCVCTGPDIEWGNAGVVVLADFARTLETELAAAKAECERLKFATEGHLLKTIQQQAELAQLRAEVERLCNQRDNLLKPMREQAIARAERAEAALAEWSVLNLWGGTPEIIHEFIKGQQNRIHHCQDLEAELAEAVDGEINGGSIPDTLLVIHVPRSPVGYRVGQPVKVILPAIDAAMKGTT